MQDNSKTTNLIGELSKVCDILYDEETEKGIQLLSNQLGNLGQIIDEIKDESIKVKFIGILQNAFSAMEKKDPILLGDILTYDLIGELLNK